MFKIGIIGFGVMGQIYHRIISSSEHLEFAGVYDPYCPATQGVWNANTIEELLDVKGLDAIIIASPTVTHHDILLQCIKRRVPVLVEKPLASRYSECVEIQRFCHEYNSSVMVGHVERFNPTVSALKMQIHNKEIQSINITRVGPYPPRIKDVGVLIDLSVHDIDLVHYLTESDVKDIKIFKSTLDADGIENNASISFLTQNDVSGTINSNWLTPFKKRTIEVVCRNEYYIADLIQRNVFEYSGYSSANGAYVVCQHHVQMGEPLQLQLDNFVRMIETSNYGLGATVSDGAKVLQVIERGLK